MTNIVKGLLWAGMILSAAYLARSQGLSENEAFGIVTGLSGVAVAALANSKSRCGSAA